MLASLSWAFHEDHFAPCFPEAFWENRTSPSNEVSQKIKPEIILLPKQKNRPAYALKQTLGKSKSWSNTPHNLKINCWAYHHDVKRLT